MVITFCLSVPHQMSKTKQDRHKISLPLSEIGSPSNKMMSDFAPEVDKYSKIAQNEDLNN